jgi:hypothetical protein
MERFATPSLLLHRERAIQMQTDIIFFDPIEVMAAILKRHALFPYARNAA